MTIFINIACRKPFACLFSFPLMLPSQIWFCIRKAGSALASYSVGPLARFLAGARQPAPQIAATAAAASVLEKTRWETHQMDLRRRNGFRAYAYCGLIFLFYTKIHRLRLSGLLQIKMVGIVTSMLTAQSSKFFMLYINLPILHSFRCSAA